jgi:transcription elongation factor/antiterminator RfaH
MQTTSIKPDRGHAQSAPPVEETSPSADVHDLTRSGGERWYVVHTLPKRELGAQLQLNGQGFRTFLPQGLKVVRHARQQRRVRSPLFPRYLFVILDLDRDRWRSVNGTFGVSSLVMAGGRPNPVPDGIVEALLSLTAGSDVIRLDCELRIGERVRVLAGPFAEAIGSLDRLDENGRVRILLDIMGRKVPAVLDAFDLARVA